MQQVVYHTTPTEKGYISKITFEILLGIATMDKVFIFLCLMLSTNSILACHTSVCMLNVYNMLSSHFSHAFRLSYSLVESLAYTVYFPARSGVINTPDPAHKTYRLVRARNIIANLTYFEKKYSNIF